jgi:CRP-like cAMP-binding protein
MGITTMLRFTRSDYMSIVCEDRNCLLRHIALQEQVVKSACDRLMEIIGERAEQRVYNMLYMLYGKFGNVLKFTSEETAELSGTATEKVMRIFSELKKLAVISSGRGEIYILNNTELINLCRGVGHFPGRI